MRVRPTMPPPTDADMLLPEYDCVACGVGGPAALVAYPCGGGRPYPLCAACARDREQLRRLVSALVSCPVPATATPYRGNAA